jgi:hypothetical protein
MRSGSDDRCSARLGSATVARVPSSFTFRPGGRARRALHALLLAALMSFAAIAASAQRADASPSQVAVIQDDGQMLANPAATLFRFRQLGADQVRVALHWQSVAPASNSLKEPTGFDAANPAAYPAALWAPFDTIIRDAAADGITVNLNVTGGAPLWATSGLAGEPRVKNYPFHQWEPSATQFGLFLRAVATRYNGHYRPKGSLTALPAVNFWSIWNEPNYGPSLAPQALPGHPGVEYSPLQYRNLLDAAWSALHATGHGSDSIVWGELAPRTSGSPFGQLNGMLPIVFLQSLYCVNSRYQELRGSAAALQGCPTTAAGSGRFAAQNPALFQASGISDHPYMRWYPPNQEQTLAQPKNFRQILPDYTSLAEIGNLEKASNRLVGVYGSHKVFPIWNTEFGYITSPPKRHWAKDKFPWVPQATAAEYDNRAEYISWKDPRIASFEQFLLKDPLPALKSNDYGGFASGLLNYNGSQKPGYGAWRMPLYMPHTTASSGQALEVWGAARPIHYALMDDPGLTQTVNFLFEPTGTSSYEILDTINVSSSLGYFDTQIVFPSSGTLAVQWSYPQDALLGASGYSVYSRHVQVTVN